MSELNKFVEEHLWDSWISCYQCQTCNPCTSRLVYDVHNTNFYRGDTCLKFIYFTTITKQVIQLIRIMLVGTYVCVRMVFVWEETGAIWGNPTVWQCDQMIISHAEARYWTRVAAVRGQTTIEEINLCF